MNVNQVGSIVDPYARLAQSHKFILGLQRTMEVAVDIRDEALIEVMNNKEVNRTALAERLGMSRANLYALWNAAKKRQTERLPPWDRD